MMFDRLLNVASTAVSIVAGWLMFAVYGRDAGLLFMVAPLVWVVWQQSGTWEPLDDARDETDLAREQADNARAEAADAYHAAAECLRRLLAIEQYLTGETEEAAGRHAHPVGET